MERDFEFIKPGYDIKFNAVIDYWTGVGDFHGQGYRRAVEVLLDHFPRDIIGTASDRDFLILPILYLFRHYLELRFKEIIVLGRIILGEDYQRPWGHELDKLWQDCRPVCEGVLGKSFSEPLDEVGRCVQEVAWLDPNSQSFRYPRDKHGNPIFKHHVICLKNLYDVVRKIADFLDGTSIQFSQQLKDLEDTGLFDSPEDG